MDLRKIRKLIEIFHATELTEIEIHEGEESIRLTRGARGLPEVVHQPVQGVEPVPAKSLEDIQIDEEEESEHFIVRAPMVGTFFLAPSPDQEPFVKVGDKIQKGEALCLIEAMKIFNQIESEYEGTIMNILKEDGEPVEYGEPLFFIGE